MDIRSMFTPEPKKDLAFTGSFFVVSGLTALTIENYLTAFFSFLLGFSSVWYHSLRTPASFVLDQVALTSVVIRSFVDGYNGSVPGMTIACVVNGYNWIIYFSPYKSLFTDHPNLVIANRWHMSIHILAILSIIAQQYCIYKPIRLSEESLRVL
uniref:Uncharacterized protein n=1 Tax=viral metagenome TaxID=1070528 RepID=A0A6C0DH24_9ZZZZ